MQYGTKTFTIEDRLAVSGDLEEYIRAFTPYYNRVYRRIWQDMTSPDHKARWPKRSKYVSHICLEYHLLKRTVNSLYNDVQGRMDAYMELKKTELRQLQTKIEARESRIAKLKTELDRLKPLAAANKLTEKQLASYRNKKASIFHQKQKLNRMKQKSANLQGQIENGIYSMGCGGKKMFKAQYRLKENGYHSHGAWKKAYLKARDKNIFYLGSRDESCGNQLFQLAYVPATDDFTATVRKEDLFCKGKDTRLKIEHIRFPYMHGQLKEAALAYAGGDGDRKPLSFRFHQRGEKLYLQCILAVDSPGCFTTLMDGAIGLDFNDGFIQLSETDEKGNLVHTQTYPLYFHGTGNRAESEIRETVSEIVKYALWKGKTIAHEGLDFRKKKAKTLKAKSKNGKRYNTMIHLLDYGRYIGCLESAAFRHGAGRVEVNPAYTTKIGKQKYAGRMKLTGHAAAAFVIARRGQGFKDKLKNKPAAKKRKAGGQGSMETVKPVMEPMMAPAQ